MGILNFFYKPSQVCLDVHSRLRCDKFCNFFLQKIPLYCPIEKILWIEADVIEHGIVKSCRVNYLHKEDSEVVDVKVPFTRYGFDSITIAQFKDFMMFLSIAFKKKRFVFLDRGYDGCHAGCIYDYKYAKKFFNV